MLSVIEMCILAQLKDIMDFVSCLSKIIRDIATYQYLTLVFVYLFVELGFELKSLLARQELCHLSHPTSPFCSGYFWSWSFVNPDWPQATILPLNLPSS
jgi:hypothetical protein